MCVLNQCIMAATFADTLSDRKIHITLIETYKFLQSGGITHNPHLKTVLDHAGLHYNPIRALLIATSMTEEEAAESLNTTWPCAVGGDV